MSRSLHNLHGAPAPKGVADDEVPKMISLERTVTTRVTSCWWRAPEMWGWADTKFMTPEHLRSLDVFAFGLIWAEMLAKESVIRSVDGGDPDKLRLLEILQKVDRPRDGETQELGFTPAVSNFIDRVLEGNTSEVERMLRGPLWKGDSRQKALLETPYTGIRQWVFEKCSLLTSDSAVPTMIEQATRFNYKARLTADSFLQTAYFDDLRERMPVNTPWAPAEVPHFDDVRAAMTQEEKEQTKARAHGRR